VGSQEASVDEHLASLDEVRRAALQELRETIRSAAPSASEAIAYGMPAFRVAGRILVSFDAYRSHVGLYPASGAVVDALGPDLVPYLHGRGTVRFPLGEPLPLNLVTWVVQVRLAEVAAADAGGGAG
jgi:uncharacterized protein YdhG (YjbR/CyaY superfamily)